MSAVRVVTFAITAAGIAFSGPALGSRLASPQLLSGLRDLSPVINVACGANYVRTHHQGSSNYVCVHRATILPSGPKFTVEPKQPLSPGGKTTSQIKTK